ncbi:Excreted virulence factor EspC, type VII ESX diderm [Gordonia westfalica]|uniref:Excreted virulence factor EspC, type VII ESX diderm n=1 Tax=Gordonia westfalica TaxID=158898 RepID=A0A1H2IHZ0_9ACTN|nr:Excreted virulence factor EspC, type VII ESX diderm [Gordonia westfalica]
MKWWGPVLVDPDALRGLSDRTSNAADVIEANTLAGVVLGAFSEMQGSTSEWSARAVDEFVTPLVKALSQGFDELSRAAKGAAGNYEATDEYAKSKIEACFER